MFAMEIYKTTQKIHVVVTEQPQGKFLYLSVCFFLQNEAFKKLVTSSVTPTNSWVFCINFVRNSHQLIFIS